MFKMWVILLIQHGWHSWHLKFLNKCDFILYDRRGQNRVPGLWIKTFFFFTQIWTRLLWFYPAYLSGMFSSSADTPKFENLKITKKIFWDNLYLKQGVLNKRYGFSQTYLIFLLSFRFSGCLSFNFTEKNN